MKILFMGTPDFAREILAELIASGNMIIGVLTQPDKPRGRGMVLTPSSVKVLALESGIPVYQPETLKNSAFASELEALDPELIVVAAYGKILPEYVLNYPKFGCINVHASLLPEYRGAAPIQRAILDGKKQTGVTIMKMEKGLDTGDMLLKIPVPILPEDNFESLHDKLAEAGRKAILEATALIECGKAVYEKQDDALSTYAAKIEKPDCILNFDADVSAVHDKIRALSPVPLAFAYLEGKQFKIVSSVIVSDKTVDAPPGTIVSCADGVLNVACRNGIIGIRSLIPEGKKKMSAADFIRGHSVEGLAFSADR